jgi:hypothetical protein
MVTLAHIVSVMGTGGAIAIKWMAGITGHYIAYFITLWAIKQ